MDKIDTKIYTEDRCLKYAPSHNFNTFLDEIEGT